MLHLNNGAERTVIAAAWSSKQNRHPSVMNDTVQQSPAMLNAQTQAKVKRSKFNYKQCTSISASVLLLVSISISISIIIVINHHHHHHHHHQAGVVVSPWSHTKHPANHTRWRRIIVPFFYTRLLNHAHSKQYKNCT